MRIAVLGVGAIGSIIGGYLARGGLDVTLIDAWPANIERIKEKGLTVSAWDEEFTVQARARHQGELSAKREHFDAVVLSVKAFDTDWSVKLIEPHLAPGGFIVSAQNGINDEAIAQIIGWTRVVGCVVRLGGGMYEAGHVLRTSPNYGGGQLVTGEPSGLVTPRLKEISEILSLVGPVKTTTNLWGERWAKLASSCTHGGVTSFAGVESYGAMRVPRVQVLGILIVSELVRVAAALGVSVDPISGISARMFLEAGEDCSKRKALLHTMREASEGAVTQPTPPVHVVINGRKTPETEYLKKAVDLRKGRRSEVEYFNGHVGRKGKDVGVLTPVNDAVVELVSRVESGRLEPSLSNLEYIEEIAAVSLS